MNSRTARAALYAALFAGAAAISAFSITRGIDPFDEGLALQAARRVADGQLPYHDFQWAYGPGQPYLLGLFWEAFGPSLLAWRVLRVALNAAVALAVFAIVGRTAPGWLAVGAWLLAACAMAQPLSANPFPAALLCSLTAIALAVANRPGAAGALTGLASVWRLDFGIYAGAALLVALRGRARATGAAMAAGLAGLLYLPFIVATGPADMWDALVGNSLRDREYWTLPFPWAYDGGLSSPAELKDLLDFYVPLLILVGTVVAAAALLVQWTRERDLPREWLAWLVFAAGGWLYLRSRTDEFHQTPLLVTLAVLLPAVIAARVQRALTGVAAVVLALLLASVVANRLSALVDPPELEPLNLAIADGVQVRPVDAEALPRVVELVQTRVPENGAIYVVTRRSDLVRIGNPLLYVLADRRNALREDFDLLTGEREQADVVRRLRSDPPPAIVRWTDPQSAAREPNARGVPSGSRELDEYIAAEYDLAARHGYYEVLVPR